MEKLIVKSLKLFAIAGLIFSASIATAGTPFRMSAKAPCHEVKRYIFGYGGVIFENDYQTTGEFLSYSPGPISVDWDADLGYLVGGGFGFYTSYLGGSRIELEISHSSQDVTNLSYDGSPVTYGGDSTISTSTVMVNFLKEVPLGKACGYFGGGIGGAISEYDGDLGGVPVGSTHGGFAWQLIAGVDYPISDCLAFFTQYRYLTIHDLEYTTDFGDFTFRADDEISSHSVVAGLRFSY